MAKKPSKEVEGATADLPVCTALILCEKLLADKDNVVSAIRIVDTITLNDKPPEVGHGVELPFLTLLATVKAGRASGQAKVMILSVGPDKIRHPVGFAPVTFTEVPVSGTNITMPLRLIWAGFGLYWLQISTTANKLIAETPILINPGPELKQEDKKDRGSSEVTKTSARGFPLPRGGAKR